MSVSVHFGDANRRQEGELSPRTPFRIAVLGDFSGRENRGAAAGPVKLYQVDRDNLETLPGKMKAALEVRSLSGDGGKIPLAFETLDDFSPEHLLERTPIFEELRKVRRQLQSNATFAQAAEKVRSWAKQAEPRTPSPETSPQDAPTGDLLGAVLEQTVETASDWEGMIQSIVAPYIKPGPPPDQKEYVAAVDQVIGDQMRALLHDRHFQRLEANWRALDRLVRRINADEGLQLYVLDVSKDELAGDLSACQKILEHAGAGVAGGAPWALLVGAYRFDATVDDARLLGRLADWASATAAPFVASVDAEVVGCDDLALKSDPDDWQMTMDPDWMKEWDRLPERPSASWLGLTMPRHLVRLPYGRSTNPVESFDFEEMPGSPVPAQYLWGEGGFLVAEALANAFAENGWRMRSPGPVDLGGMPVHLYVDEDGDSAATPPTECLLTERAVNQIADGGLIPLIAVRNQDVVRIPGLRSVAGVPLSGKWQS